MKNIISDDKLIINIQAMRYIKKSDREGRPGCPKYLLEWEHKGSSGNQEYEDKKERDDMFEKIVEIIKK